MRHVYECPTRWADLDMLGHVNNVVYVDYLQEARVDMMRTLFADRRGDLTEGVVVVAHAVTYLTPLTFGRHSVTVECWVTEVRAATFTLGYEVLHTDADGNRTVYVRATTTLTPYVFADERPRRITVEEKALLADYLEPGDAGRRPAIEVVDRDRAHHFPLHVRFSDVDAYRHVNNVKYFEFLQESRIRMIGDLVDREALAFPGLVVAQTDVEYRAPVLMRAEPYDLFSEIVRVGGRSMTVESEIADGATTLARGRVVVVFFDPRAGHSVEPSDEVRAALTSSR